MADTNKIRYGFRSVYFSVITEGAGAPTYAEPVAWKGAKSLSLDAEGETSTYYADDIAYFTTNTNNGYTGTLEMSYLSEEFKEQVLGYVKTQDGMLAEDANVLPKPFALLCEFQGDAKATRHIWYKVVASRPSTEANTKEESVEPDTISIDISAVPVVSDDGANAWVKADAASEATNYATFFTTAPTLPTVGE